MLFCCGKRSSIAAWSMVAGLVLGWGCSGRTFAVGRNYTIDTTQSSIAISGTVFSVDLNQTKPIVQQGAGGLTTTYTGTIKTDRTTGNIGFLGGSTIDANVSGNWRPLADGADGTAPADYGGRANFTVLIVIPNPVYFAGRDLVADVSSAALAVNGSNQFGLSTTNLTFTSGSLAYRDSNGVVVGAGSIVGEGGLLTGNGTLGTLSQGGRVYETLTLPMDSSFVLTNASATINLTLTGQLFATYLIPSTNGDYNQNGKVDAADYVVWRNSMGQTGVGLAADGNGDNQITSADRTVWRSKFGQPAGSGAGEGQSFAAAVPESSSLVLFIAGLVLGRVRCRGQFRR